MTVLSRGARVRRGGRRPGWLLLTALLVLAIGASSALVFTNRVELLKLAVILALWAAVVAAFVSVIYRRQSDVDQARVRDLKLVYDLQLDREISARREYELTVESQLRRELASELRAQAADEVAALRSELAALRTNLEILFETDLDQRPALETEHASVRAYREWGEDSDDAPADWVASNRVTAVRAERTSSRAEENSIIDVPEEPVPRQASDAFAAANHSVPAYQAAEGDRGTHWRESGNGSWPAQARRPSDTGPQEQSGGRSGRRARRNDDTPTPPEPRFDQGPPRPEAEAQRGGWPSTPTEMPAETPRPTHPATEWHPVDAEGRWVPAGTWVSDHGPRAPQTDNAADNGGAPVGPMRGPAAEEPPLGPRRGRHSGPPHPAAPPAETESGRRYAEAEQQERARHSVDYPRYDDGGEVSSPTTEPLPPAPPEPPNSAPTMPPTADASARHRTADESARGPQTGGHSVADLLTRLQAEPTGGGRRRRRED